MSKERITLIKLFIRLTFTIIFLSVALYEIFYGDRTNGILWLILLQIYDNGGKRGIEDVS